MRWRLVRLWMPLTYSRFGSDRSDWSWNGMVSRVCRVSGRCGTHLWIRRQAEREARDCWAADWCYSADYIIGACFDFIVLIILLCFVYFFHLFTAVCFCVCFCAAIWRNKELWDSSISTHPLQRFFSSLTNSRKYQNVPNANVERGRGNGWKGEERRRVGGMTELLLADGAMFSRRILSELRTTIVACRVSLTLSAISRPDVCGKRTIRLWTLIHKLNVRALASSFRSHNRESC